MALFIVLGQPLSAQGGIDYISPGLQIGYTFGAGIFVSTQITIGFLGSWNYSFPGATVGYRWQANEYMVYLDVQYSMLFGGIGVGQALIFTKSGNGAYNFSDSGFRAKLFAGFYGYATFDYLNINGKQGASSIGLMGVYPIPVGLDTTM